MPRTTQSCQTFFHGQLTERLALLHRSRRFHLPNSFGVFGRIHVRDMESIAGLVVLKVHLDWEYFLESAYTRFLSGYVNGQGHPAPLIVARQTSLGAASTFIRTRVRNGATTVLPYVNWNRDSLEARARLHFHNGDPFVTAFQPAVTAISDFYVVRNRLAHRSGSSVQEFENVVRRELGQLPRGMTAGRFLLTTNRRAIGGPTYLDTYVRTLQTVSHSIAA